MSTDVIRRSSLDLTRAPDEQWNAAMVQVVAKNVFRGKEITMPQLYYCLSVSDSLDLNPMIGEIYFLPSKSRNAEGPAWTPYIGRNGLVNKAEISGYYYESDTVHENDKFRIYRRAGTQTCTHSYSAADRGEIIGAYAFLHRRDGTEKPSFFYAKLSEYLPTYDADWKMDASPWGNQRSAMIEKCAMIGAGRKRLRLGNVLIDAEGAIVQQMGELAGPHRPAEDGEQREFDWSTLNAPPELVERLREAVQRANELEESAWTPAKLELILTGMAEDEVEALAARIEGHADSLAQRAQHGAADTPAGSGGVSVEEAGGSGSGPENASEEIADAEVVDDAEHAARLRAQLRTVEDAIRQAEEAGADVELGDLSAQHDQLSAELAALEDPGQSSLL